LINSVRSLEFESPEVAGYPQQCCRIADLARHRYFTLSVARAHKFLKLKAAKKT